MHTQQFAVLNQQQLSQALEGLNAQWRNRPVFWQQLAALQTSESTLS